MTVLQQDEQQHFAVKPGWIQTAIDALTREGVAIWAPIRGDDNTITFAHVTSEQAVAQDYVNTRLPLKALLLPRSETLLHFKKQTGGDVEMFPEPTAPPQTVVIGCRPCDAAAVNVIDNVFYWDYEDLPYRARRDALTFVSFACQSFGSSCFCHAVGGSPHDERGSDVLVFLNADGGATLKTLTDKGERFIQRLGDSAVPASEKPVGAPAPPAPLFNPDMVKQWLDTNFENDLWKDISLACLGCGACSYLCPTCHCFDIVDEATWNRGARRRNWDCCSYKNFTMHASGHNPRPDQTTRCRQRVMHKFKYFPERFGAVACVGCGRCILNCGAGQHLPGILARIQEQLAIEAQKE